MHGSGSVGKTLGVEIPWRLPSVGMGSVCALKSNGRDNGSHGCSAFDLRGVKCAQ